jgi:hypothetical protein
MEEDMILKQFFHYRGKAQARSTVKDMVVLVKSVTEAAKAEPVQANAEPAQAKKEYEPHDKSEKETLNLEKIHFHIKNDTPSGKKIKEEFGKTFPDIKVFDETVVTGGNRTTHHDFGIKWLAEEVKKVVEFKGSEKKKPIDGLKPPWENAVQFYNGTGNKFTVGHSYAKKFYATALDEIIAHLALKTPKPSYDEWEKDAFSQGKPKTPFVCELREKGYKGKYLSDMRKKFNKAFVLEPTELEILKGEVLKKANEVLEEKDYWLQINGNIDEPADFEIRWSGKIGMREIIEIKQIGKSGCDINFEFTCEGGNKFFGKLRWGYGQCITNIRLDLK